MRQAGAGQVHFDVVTQLPIRPDHAVLHIRSLERVIEEEQFARMPVWPLRDIAPHLLALSRELN
jgi:hypothetical protein